MTMSRLSSGTIAKQPERRADVPMDGAIIDEILSMGTSV
jgi:hypothetical protein